MEARPHYTAPIRMLMIACCSLCIWDRNYKRKSVEGLSPIMFVNAVLGNTTYGIAILMRGPASRIKAAIPFLVGSLGTVALDATILHV